METRPFKLLGGLLCIMARIPTPWREVFPPPSNMSLFFLGGVGVCSLMFCRSLVASPNSLNQARFPDMSSPNMCLVFLFPFHFIVAFFRVYL